MARRSEDWNVGLAKDLRDAAFAREFLLASIDDQSSPQSDPGHVQSSAEAFRLRLSLAPLPGKTRPNAA